MGGSMVLTKSVLSSLPIYPFQTVNPSLEVCVRMDIIFNKIFLGLHLMLKGYIGVLGIPILARLGKVDLGVNPLEI